VVCVGSIAERMAGLSGSRGAAAEKGLTTPSSERVNCAWRRGQAGGVVRGLGHAQDGRRCFAYARAVRRGNRTKEW
jgi:hypothetical protein